jgi:hypothetical protein
LLNDLGQAIEKHHSMPLGFLFLFTAGFVLPGITRGEGNIGNPIAIWHHPELRIITRIPYKNYFIHTSTCHVFSPLKSIYRFAKSIPWAQTLKILAEISPPKPFEEIHSEQSV